MIVHSSFHCTLAVLKLKNDTAKASAEHAQPGNARSLSVSAPILADMLFQFKENPDAWLLVDKILQEASYPQTKCQLAIDAMRWGHTDRL